MSFCRAGLGGHNIELSSDWGTTTDGRKVSLYTLTGKGGLQARISDYGGDIVALNVPGWQGWQDRTLCWL